VRALQIDPLLPSWRKLLFTQRLEKGRSRRSKSAVLQGAGTLDLEDGLLSRPWLLAGHKMLEQRMVEVAVVAPYPTEKSASRRERYSSGVFISGVSFTEKLLQLFVGVAGGS
jgi:hypothetical protein